MTACSLRPLVCRNKGIYNRCDPEGIDHLSVCVSGMDIAPVNSDHCTCSIEVLVRYLPYPSAVNCIGIIRTEFGNIKMLGSFTYLLIRGKSNAYLSMRGLRVLQKITDHTHDLCYPGFVISTEKRSSVSSDQCLPCVKLKIRKKYR